MNEWRLMAMGSAVAKAAFANQAWKAHQHCAMEYVAKIDEVCNRLMLPSALIQQEESSFLTSLAEGIGVMYLCRVKSCGYYGMDDQWIQSQFRYSFWCPHCGVKCDPWKQNARLLQFQQVISVSHPFTGERWVIPAVIPAGPASAWDFDLLEGMLVAATSNLQTGRQPASEDNLDAYYSLGNLQALDTLLSNVGQPADFQHFTLGKNTQALLRALPNEFGPMQFAKVEGCGYYGNILNAKLGTSKQPFTDWTKFVALFVSLLSASQASWGTSHCT